MTDFKFFILGWCTHNKTKKQMTSLQSHLYDLTQNRLYFSKQEFPNVYIQEWQVCLFVYFLICNHATIAQIILKFLFFFFFGITFRIKVHLKEIIAFRKESARIVVLPYFLPKMVLAGPTPLPWLLPVALSCFQLFPDLITMLRADGFVSTELMVVGNKNKPGAPEGNSLKRT